MVGEPLLECGAVEQLRHLVADIGRSPDRAGSPLDQTRITSTPGMAS
jgi:hypothetical protein